MTSQISSESDSNAHLGCLRLLKEHSQWATIPMQKKRDALWESRFIVNAGFRVAELLHLRERSGGAHQAGHPLDVAKELPPSFQLALADPSALAPWLLPAEEAG